MNSGMLFRKLLLIYQMPKVGSQTIEATLQQCSLRHQVHRFHFLSAAFAAPIREKLLDTEVPEAWKQGAREQLQFMVKTSRILRVRNILRACGLPIPKLEVISGLREPIGLTLSSIFENYSFFFKKPESVTFAHYQEILLRPRAMDLAQRWFDWELKPFTGLDVYSEAFPRQTGYAIYENRFARALVYRYEALEKLPAMLHEFLGCEIPAVLKRNIGSSKEYSHRYRDAKERLRLPSPFVASQCNSRMMQHFYSEEERRTFQESWTQKDEANAEAKFSAKSAK